VTVRLAASGRAATALARDPGCVPVGIAGGAPRSTVLRALLRRGRAPRRSAAWIAVLALLASTGCAAHQARRARERNLAVQLDALRYPKPLEEVWREARQLLADRGYPLVGEDASAVGQPDSWVTQLLSPGRETRVKGGEQVLETGWKAGSLPHRVRLGGTRDGEGCRVVITAIAQDPTEHWDGERRRDVELELELARRLVPEEAARIEALLSGP